MQSHTIDKSSFTLPADEVLVVRRLKRHLRLKSNTEVVRRALRELEAKIDREKLRAQFQEASLLVRKVNRQDMADLDRTVGDDLA